MNNGHKWTDDEIKLLRKEVEKHRYNEPLETLYYRIGQELGVSGAAVRMKYRDLRNDKALTIRAPKVLFFDIETLTIVFEGWSLRQDGYVNPERILKDWSISSWAAKWLGDDKIYSASVTGAEAVARDDARILPPLLKLLNKADIVIAHNGKKFDVKRVNTRLFFNGLDPLYEFHVVDTLLESRSKFAFSSFRLDYLTKILGINQGKSEDTGDAFKCGDGNVSELRKRKKYNERDVLILEDYFWTILPYIKRPDFRNWSNNIQVLGEDETECRVCFAVINKTSLSKNWHSAAGYRYKQFRCPSCGSVGRLSNRGEAQHRQSGKRL